ncbi:MAG: helix-turn-helix domain-containing protein [Candidatus Ornithomonoglobus sp.]
MKRISELRKEKHLNQTGLGMLLNVSQKMISAYESGIHQPSIETLKQMSKIFNVSVDYIIENTDIKTPVDQFARNELKFEEIELLSIFKDLSKNEQQRAIGIIFALKHYND